MADKKITELQLISAIGDDLNLVGDDGIQSYRLTAAQLKAYVRPGITSTTTTPYTVVAADDIILIDASGGAKTVNLPAAASNNKRVLTIKKTDSGTNAITIDGNSTELIDADQTLVMDLPYQSVTLVCNGTKWSQV